VTSKTASLNQSASSAVEEVTLPAPRAAKTGDLLDRQQMAGWFARLVLLPMEDHLSAQNVVKKARDTVQLAVILAIG
jgi:hypothetical protein